MAVGELPNVKKILEAFGVEAVKRLQDAITKKDKIATGNLFQSINYTVKFFGRKHIFRLFFDPPADDYAQAVDEGRRPGKQPPMEPILKWIIAKPVDTTPRKMPAKRRKPRNRATEARSLAFLIARKIGKRGTKGSRFWSDNIPSLIKEVKADLSKAFKKDIQIEVREIRKEFNKK